MSYEQSKNQVVSSVTSSDLPSTIITGISRVLSDFQNLTLEEITVPGAISESTDFANVKSGGTFTSSQSTKVLLFDTIDDVSLTISPPPPGAGPEPVTVVLGSGNDSLSYSFANAAAVGENALAAEDGNVAGSTIEGGAGNDTLGGSSGDDSISGGVGDDSISGGAGDDRITVGTGNDTVDGGTGFDTVELQTGRSSYGISVQDGTIVLTNADSGTKSLTGVEFVSFDDGTIVLGLENQKQGDVARLYETMLDRGADAAGVKFWIEQLENGMSLQEIAGYFATSEEFQALGVGNDNGKFLEALYQQTFDRAADADGKEFWLGVLENTDLDRGDVASNFAQSAEAIEDFDYIQIIGVNFDIA